MRLLGVPVVECDRCGREKEPQRANSLLCGACNRIEGRNQSSGRRDRLGRVESAVDELVRMLRGSSSATTGPTGDFFPESGRCPLYVPPPLDGCPMPSDFREQFAPHLRRPSPGGQVPAPAGRTRSRN